MAVTDIISKATTVTVANGSNVIQVADKTNLAINDEVIIESQHGYGETGLGGSFTWTNPSGYYFGVTMGKSIRTSITNISGNDITLATTVPAEAVGVPLFRDNTQGIKAKIVAGTSWSAYEDQTLHIGSHINPLIPDDSEQTFDFKNTEWKSPKGTPCAGFRPLKQGGGNPWNKVYKNLRLTGNCGDYGYGPTGDATSSQAMNKNFHILSYNTVIDNVTLTDPLQGFLLDNSDDCVIQNCYVIRTQPLRTYIQWDMLVTSSRRCVIHRCNYDSDYPAPFCEAFKSVGIVFSDCTSRNGVFSINTAGRVRYINCSSVWDWISDGSDNVMTPSSSYFPVTRIVEGQQGAAQTGTEGGTLLLGCSVHVQQITFPPNRICYNHLTHQSPYIATNARIYDDTYTIDPVGSDTNNASFGYWINAAVNDTSLEVGGENSVTQLTGISQNKYTRYVNGVLTVMPVPGES